MAIEAQSEGWLVLHGLSVAGVIANERQYPPRTLGSRSLLIELRPRVDNNRRYHTAAEGRKRRTLIYRSF